jgi:hypothetical protein
MNAIAYTDRNERVVTLAQGVKQPSRIRCHWLHVAGVHRAKAGVLVYRSRKRAVSKTRVAFIEPPRGVPSPWNRVIHLPSANPWVAKVWSFTRLSPGWNGGRAPAPTLAAIGNAARFVFAMAEAGYRPTRIAPSAVGGVAMTRRVGERKALVEFFNDGSASALFADDATRQMETQRVPVTPGGLRDLLDKSREYLDG